MKIIASYLPIFPGFYSTIFESYIAEEQYLEDEDLYSDNVEFDYKDYETRVAESCINSIWNYLKLDGFSIDIDFEEVYNPREYNFENDAIYCTYKVSDEDFNTLIEYCKTHISDFKTFLEDKYSSHSGFISFFSTDANKWFNEYLDEDDSKFEKAFAGILEFYLKNEGYSSDDMFDDNEETSYINVKEAV
ncbi:MAG: hypothetical protein CMH22_06005 [Methylophaga sp.]|nr:hypothetical protein [Methylophaga sp.]|tara:strand:+ start:62111 stop:62680 length:570 start_codon:yes stop_codon:yes gene_type:complete